MPTKRAADCAYDSPASVCEFQGYEAGDRDGEVELLDDCFQICQAASKWIDRNDVPVTRGGQCRDAEIEHARDLLRTANWGIRLSKASGLSSQIRPNANAKIVARLR